MTSPRPSSLWTGLLAGAACASLLAAPSAFGQPAPAQAPETRTNAVDEGRAAPGEAGALPIGGGYDYFAARVQPGLQSYLGQVTARHASERVWAAFWAGKYTESLGDCEYVLARFPNHPRALHLIGEISKATNEVSLAIGYFENALRLYPQYAYTHAQYGHYLTTIGVVTAGVEQLREALRIDPGQFQAKAWLAEALAAHPELEKGSPATGPGGKADTPGAAASKGNR